MRELSEIRWYQNGWIVRLGPLCLRWNHQPGAYTSLSVERLNKDMRHIGGMTWREFRIARRQARASSAAKA